MIFKQKNSIARPTDSKIINEISSNRQLLNICLENQGQGPHLTDKTKRVYENYQIKITPVKILNIDSEEMLVECYYDEDIIGLYIAKIKGDIISNLWFFPSKDEARVYISDINIQDIDNDGNDDISYRTYYHGGPCTWYNSSVTVYNIKDDISFSRSIFANAIMDKENECTTYSNEKDKYSDNIKYINPKMLEYINSVDLIKGQSE